MQNFSFKRKVEPQEVLIETPKKKINRQQQLFTLFFLLVAISLIWYFAKDLFYATFEGNIISHHGENYLMNDAFLLDVTVESGDIVNAGDTMLYFMYTDMFYSAMSPETLESYKQKISVLINAKKKLILELRTVINQKNSLLALHKEVRQNILLGLSTVGEEATYLIEIENIAQEINYMEKVIQLNTHSIDSIILEHENYMDNLLDPFENTSEYMLKNKSKFGDMLQYLVAPEKTLILAINKYPGNIIFKEDPIMLIYPIDEGAKRIHIEMIVPPRFLNEMTNGDKVEIYFGKKYLDDGTIKINNTYMKKVNSVKLGHFSADQEGAIIRVNIDNPSKLSLKYQVSGLPVELTYKRKLFPK